MKIITMGFLALSTATSFATSVIVTNSQGLASIEIVDNGGNLVAGFGGVGIIDEGGLNGALTTFAGLSFNQYGTAGGVVTTSIGGQFNFGGNLNLDNAANSAFLNRNIYLLAGFGGTDLASSTSLFVYKFTAGFGAAEAATPITPTLGSSPGAILLGTTGTGTFQALAITVPEPSSVLLLALGGLGLLFRRKR